MSKRNPSGSDDATRTGIPQPSVDPHATLSRPRLSTDGPSAESRPADKQIGRFRLLELLGQGGMGEVWVAEQTEPVKRKVALKLIKSGFGSAEILARFEAERQALAVMEHPNVARILDGGTTDQGQPYFVMELIEGQPLTAWCDQRRLGIEQRLRLFVDVCNGVQHAHQKGIIHRDLKPGNILVSEVDGKPVPKIIDFGLARAIEGNQRLTDQSLMTGVGQILGTLRYMSPEQASLEVVDIDTRTDIYALGVILYELLTGSTPLNESSLKSQAVLKVLELIREQDPVRPSRRLESSTDAEVSGMTSLRQTDRARLTRILAGDLDWIVMKALEKDRNRRYESASGMAADVRRYLDSEPVIARPPSLNYRVRKFVRKNLVGVIAASFVLMSVAGGMLGTTWGMIRARAAGVREMQRADGEREARQQADQKRQEAEKNLAYSRKANSILASVFANLDPDARYATVADLRDALRANLANAAVELQDSAIGDPITTAMMQRELGASMLSLSATDQARELMDQAASTLNDLLGPRHAETLLTQYFQAEALRHAGNLDEAIKLMSETVALQKETLGNTNPATIKSMCALGDLYRFDGRWSDALPVLEEAYRLALQALEPDHSTTLAIMNNLAITYHHAREFGKAIDLQEQVVERSRALLGDSSPNTLIGITNLAGSYQESGDAERAVELLEPALVLQQEQLGNGHAKTFVTMQGLAEAYEAAGYRDKAIPLYERIHEFRKRALGAEHPDTVNVLNCLAIGYAEMQKFDLALPFLEEAYEISKKARGADHPHTLSIMHNLAQCYRSTGKAHSAVELLEQTVELSKARFGATHPDTVRALNSLGMAYYSAGNLTLATSTLERTLPEMQKLMGNDHQHTKTTMWHLAECYLATGRPASAMPLLEEAFAGYRRLVGPNDVNTLKLMNALAVASWKCGKLDKSVPLFEQLVQLHDEQLGRHHLSTQFAIANLGVNYRDAGRLDEAIPLLEEAHASSRKQPQLAWATSALLNALVRAGQSARFEALADEQLESVRKTFANRPHDLAAGLAIVADGYLIFKKYGTALALLEEVVELRKASLPNDWTTFNAISMLGGAKMGVAFSSANEKEELRLLREAEPLLVAGYIGMKDRLSEIPPNSQSRHLEALDRLLELYSALGKTEEVEKWRSERTQIPSIQ